MCDILVSCKGRCICYNTNMNHKLKWVIVSGILIAVVLCLAFALAKTGFWKGGRLLPKLGRQKDEGGKELVGVWTAKDDKNFVIEIWQDKKGLFHISATKPLDDKSACFWECQGRQAGKKHEIPYYNGTKTIMTYDMDGNENEEPVYTGAQGTFYKKDGTLFWKDQEEGAADGVVFVYTGEY